MKLKYGEEKFELDLDRLGDDVEVLLPEEKDGVGDPLKEVADSLKDLLVHLH